MDDPPARQSRLICSNSSTRDLAIPDLHADNNDVTIRSRVWPELATTRRPTRQGRSQPRRGRNSRRQKAKPGPVQVITLTPCLPAAVPRTMSTRWATEPDRPVRPPADVGDLRVLADVRV